MVANPFRIQPMVGFSDPELVAAGVAVSGGAGRADGAVIAAAP